MSSIESASTRVVVPPDASPTSVKPAPDHDWIRRSQPPGDLERIEAFFQAHAYAMHSHDTYGIGVTMRGVQSFHYRRAFRSSLPGQTIVIHPDEPHDGESGSDTGFQYRMVYVAPSLLQDVLGDNTLPFVADGISDDPRLRHAALALLGDLRHPLEPLERDDALWQIAQALKAVSGGPMQRHTGDFHAARRAREMLDDDATRAVTLDMLADQCGRDRWRLSRDFRHYFGTSPHRYLTMRRLDIARRLMLTGQSLADSAAMAGFADQSHMTRHFAKAYGMPPARWLRTLAQGSSHA